MPHNLKFSKNSRTFLYRRWSGRMKRRQVDEYSLGAAMVNVRHILLNVITKLHRTFVVLCNLCRRTCRVVESRSGPTSFPGSFIFPLERIGCSRIGDSHQKPEDYIKFVASCTHLLLSSVLQFFELNTYEKSIMGRLSILSKFVLSSANRTLNGFIQVKQR